MTSSLLPTVEVETGAHPQATVLWLHGLGADGHDFEPLVPHLAQIVKRPLRFIFPHAPVCSVTVNAGMQMRAWYDITDNDFVNRPDETGIRASAAAVDLLLRKENERGIPSDRIVLAGFSQGGVISLYTAVRYPQKLAGVMGLSCYLAAPDKLVLEDAGANRTTPVFLAHGAIDPMIGEAYGLKARAALEAVGYAVEWHSYRMGHEVCGEEIADIAAFLRRALP
jgi:phospholipase/carboxylesterase